MNYPSPKSSRLSALLSNIFKISLAAGLIYWLIKSGSIKLEYLTVSPDKITSFIEAILLLALCMMIGAMRFKELLHGAGVNISVMLSLKINAIMYFFTQCVLGAASGDVARFFYTAKETGHRPKVGAAIMLDRIIGLMGLFMLAGFGIVFNWSLVESSPGLRLLAPPLLAILCFSWLSFLLGYLALIKDKKTAIFTGLIFPVFAVFIYFSNTSLFICSEIVPAFMMAALASLAAPFITPELLEGGLIHKKIFAKTKLGNKIGELMSALLVYKDSPKILFTTVAITAVQHILTILSLYLFSQAQNLPTVPDFNEIFFAAPLAFLASLVPAPAAGLGVNEAAFEALLATISQNAISAGASIYLMQRIWTTIFALSGIPFIIKSKSKKVDSA